MRQALLISIALCYSLIGNTQVHTINNYEDGFRITYYVGECGNEIPEAEGKVHFCDAAGNQAVVENSFGLSSNYVNRMEANFFNDDQLFITRGGLSIHKEDGTWDNIPNRAAPNFFGDPGQDNKIIREAIYLPDGRIIFIGTGIGQQIDVYEPVSKELSVLHLDTSENNSYPWAIEYDADRDVVWILGGASTDKKLYKLDGETITLEADIDLVTVNSGYEQDICVYTNDNLYYVSSQGMTGIDIENAYEETFYDQTNTGLLPFNIIGDIEVDDAGMIWLAQSQNSPTDGGITHFDPITETYSSYQVEDLDPGGYNVRFNKIGIDPQGHVWAITSDFGGNVELDISGGDPIWTWHDNASYDDLGLPYIYNVGFIHTQNGRTYFCTNSASTGSNDEFEILILEDGNWSGINDNEEGNFSNRMTRGDYERLLSDPEGGVWWFDQYGDEFLYLKDEDEFDFYHSTGYNEVNLCSIESDGNLTMLIDGELGGFSEGVFTAYEEYTTSQIFDITTSAGTTTWALDNAIGISNALVRFTNGVITESYLLEDLGSYFYMEALSDGTLVFARSWSGTVFIQHFDPTTEELMLIAEQPAQGTFRELIAGNNGDFWTISGAGLTYYNSIDATPLTLDADNTEMNSLSGNVSLYDAVLDTDMNLHVMQGLGRIYTFSSPYDDLQVETIQFTGNTGVMPFASGSQQGYWMIGLDAEGDIWFAKRGEQLYELKDDISAGEYHVSTPLALKEELPNIEFFAYPNPVDKGLLNIALPPGLEHGEVFLFSMQGALVQTGSFNTDQFIIELNATSGIYSLQVITEQAIGSKLVVVK